MTLAAQPASVSSARRFAKDELGDVVDDGVLADAVLLVSELVSNAVLHASGPVVLTVAVELASASVRLEVEDASPVPPVLRDYGSHAATGRGLALVERVSSAWGVEAAGTGKIVWVELTAVGSAPPMRRPSTPLPSPESSGGDPDPAAVPVVFQNVPVHLYLQLQEQNDGVLRELELLAFTADHEGELEPSPQLVSLVERARRYFNANREGFRGAVLEAAARGEAAIDLRGSAGPASIEPSAELVALFEQAEELARRDQLLIGPATAEVAHLRRWFVDEMTAQVVEGRPPRRYQS